MGRRGRIIAVLSLIVFGVLLRFVFVWNHREDVLYGDQRGYYAGATHLVDQHALLDGKIIRPPMYQLFLSLPMKAFGKSVAAIRMTQVILSGLSLLLCYLLAREVVVFPKALAATAIVAFYPLSIVSPLLLLSELLFTPLLLLALFLTFRFTKNPDHDLLAVFVGSAWGLACLTRSVAAGFFLVTVFAVFVLGKRASVNRRSLVVMVVAFVAVLSPWTVRNAVRHGAFIPISEEASFNLWFRGSGIPMEDFFSEKWLPVDRGSERNRLALVEALGESPRIQGDISPVAGGGSRSSGSVCTFHIPYW